MRVTVFLLTLALSGVECKAPLSSGATPQSYIRLLDVDPPVAGPNGVASTPLAVMRQSPDGNILFLYTATVPGAVTTSIELTETDANGNVRWTSHFPSTTSNGTDSYVAGDCIALSNGTIAVAGSHLVSSNGNGSKFELLFFDANGNLKLNKEYAPAEPSLPFLFVSTISQTDPGDLILCGWAKQSTNSTGGNKELIDLWLSGSGDSLGVGTILPILGTAADNYELRAMSALSGDSALGIGSDKQGTGGDGVLYLWQAPDTITYAGYLANNVRTGTLRSIIRKKGTSSYIIAGDTNYFAGTPNTPWIGQVGPPFAGNDNLQIPTWTRGILKDTGTITNIIQTADGGLAATGYSVSASDTSLTVFRFTINGTDVWPYKTYPFNGGDIPYNIIELPNGDLIVGGVTTSFGSRSSGVRQIFLIHLKSDGTPGFVNIISS